MNSIPASAAQSSIRGRPTASTAEWCDGRSDEMRDQGSSETKNLSMEVPLFAEITTLDRKTDGLTITQGERRQQIISGESQLNNIPVLYLKAST
jgi:hypothetical protein